jgi:4-amino-4-deoxy-L-arabinose transferase-like glycosyltransferase
VLSIKKILIGTLVVKLIIGAWLPLFSDETYYWFWSHHMQLSFYDHPPFVAWLYWLGHPLESFGNAVRWPGIIFGHGTLVILAKLIEPYVDEKKLKLFLIFFLLNPLVGWGSLAVLPDTPLLFFWCLSLFCLLRFINTLKWQWGLALGTALGLGFCSKYHIVVFVLIALVWLIWTWQWRKIPLSAVAACIVSGLIFSLPVLIWNYQNDYDSFRFQLNHGLGVAKYNPRWAFDFTLTHLGLIFPTTLFVIFKSKLKRETDWLYYFGFGPLLFFLLSSLKGRPEANWPSIAYPAILALSFVVSEHVNWARKTIALWAVLFVLVIAQVAYPWIPVAEDKLKTNELVEYDILIKVAESYTPFYASSLQMASTLSYKMRVPIYKLKGVGRRDFFDYLEESEPKTDGFFVAFRQWDQLPAWASEYKVVNQIVINPTFTLLELKKN